MPISTEPLNVLDILRSIPDSVLTIDAEKRLVGLNEPAQTLTGTREASAVGRPCGQILRSEICDTERCPFHRSLLGGETVTTFNIMAKDGTGSETPIRPDRPPGGHPADPRAPGALHRSAQPPSAARPARWTGG
jgi:PAS domain-containing protein